MTDQLIVAIPSKGRLQEQTLAFLERSGLPVRQARGARDYFGTIGGVADAAVQFRSASEIAREVGAGNVHLAVTGVDLLHETLDTGHEEIRAGADLGSVAPAGAHIVTKLGFGHADVVVAVPQAWLDVQSMADLADVAARFRLKHHRPMRVATKYVSLTRRFLTGHGVHDYLIVESPGATEGAPAAGTAELVVDITSTGRTLAENGLKIVDDGVIMRSEAALVASLGADWGTAARRAARVMLTRIAADARARSVKRIAAALPADADALAVAADRFGATRPFVDRAELLCPAKQVHACAAFLVEAGASTVTVAGVDYVFEADNPLYDALARLWPTG
ncbi:ATP phosphoribosyltransferase [Oharaeibacter diazotrophicus]|uniref:ATP phosphoribosyltransferase n=1 Tax=Oharaeibacter diazotrophicus TaxID=1920512 RepID=A0A4R6RBV1_9HYPH|nr:ATP phosphoribosyltransferase [Oharaeibacter diazotrophicus]TDP83475.1 ATP phosphoribosyltransferase [Oharaeibacter diazotrophicus]BBE72308.1 ATP phosphoribosyltransferase [Pleomorphomonas sp. SM30]GLS79078.1 ATP phosphoribosyltransferase [Oharaeibacter diazotrophicus]